MYTGCVVQGPTREPVLRSVWVWQRWQLCRRSARSTSLVSAYKEVDVELHDHMDTMLRILCIIAM